MELHVSQFMSINIPVNGSYLDLELLNTNVSSKDLLLYLWQPFLWTFTLPTRFSLKWALVSLSPPLSAWTMSPYFSWVIFLQLSLVRRNIFLLWFSCHLCSPALGSAQPWQPGRCPSIPVRRTAGGHQGNLIPLNQAPLWGKGWGEAEMEHEQLGGVRIMPTAENQGQTVFQK